MYRSHVVRRPFGSLLTSLIALLTLSAGGACSSYLEDMSPRPDTERDVTPATNPMPGSAGSGSAGSSTGALAAESTPPTEGRGPAPSAPSSSGGGDAPASTGAAAVSDVCDALGAEDACGSCVCAACRMPLADCADIPGCSEILACVRESGCSGNECYCGDARLTECVLGGGNGPCKAAVLAAPGGQEPSLADPSGGPASDAALGVAECADDSDACGDVCDIEG